jgi:hypothetical protein
VVFILVISLTCSGAEVSLHFPLGYYFALQDCVISEFMHGLSSVPFVVFSSTLLIKPSLPYTPLAVVLRARKTLRVSTTAGIAQIPTVSSKEGAVIGAVLGTREFHRGHH